MSLLSKLAQAKGLTPETVPKNSSLGRFFGAEPVKAGPEFNRIRALPRHVWTPNSRLTELLSKHLRRSGSTETLYDWQAIALQAVHDQPRGAIVVADLGAGKTHVSALAPTLCESKKTLILGLSRLEEKTRNEFRDLNKSWYVSDFTYLTVEKLSRENYANYLEEFGPDLIVVDESQNFADPDGPRFRRLQRYVSAHGDTRLLCLTATPGSDSIRRFAHLHTLVQERNSPLPQGYELFFWAEALDAEVRGQRRPVGVLSEFAGGDNRLEQVREKLGQWIAETPGCVYYRQPDGCPCNLYISSIKFDDVSPKMDEYCAAALYDECLPDGRPFQEMYDKSLILKQLGCGFTKVLNPAPPTEWRDARGLVARFCREVIATERCDTPAQVKRLVRTGELDDGGLLEMWREIEPTFTPTPVTEWYDTSVVEYCARRLVSENLLVWTTFPTFGRKLAEVSGVPFFHQNGRDVQVGSIEDYKGGPAILAVRPNMLGRNLQDRWHKALYVCPPSDPDALGQSIGRIARRGQRAECVEIEILLSVRENWNSVVKARTRAAAEIGGNKSSRLLQGDWSVPDLSEVCEWRGPRWQR